MKLAHLVTAATFAVMLSAQPGLAQTKSGVDKLYVLNCGEGVGPDQARWSPGVNVGKPLAISDNCYLIHHAQGWFMWDTGVAEAIAAMPNGQWFSTALADAEGQLVLSLVSPGVIVRV